MPGDLPQRILVPTDLSDFGKVALEWAALFRKRLGSRITLMFANEPYFPVDVLEMAASYPLLAGPEIRDRLAEEVREYAQENFTDASAVETMIVDGAAAPAIIEAAKKINADLILMGTHGRRGVRRILLGSVTESVLHHTDRPLMSVPPPEVWPSEPRIKKVLCPVNFTPIARKALEKASAVAKAFEAELILVHVKELSGEQHFEKWVEQTVDAYKSIVVEGNAAEQVLRNAEEKDVDVIVIGAQHKRFRDATVIGTTTTRVVRFAHRPVLTVIGDPPAS